MSKASVSAAVLLSVVTSAATVRPQDQPARNDGRIQGILGFGLSPTWKPKSQLLEDPQVQKEIDLSLDQRERIKTVLKDMDQALARHNQETRNRMAQLRSLGDLQ